MEISQHLQQVKPSYIREILSAAKSPGVISLAGGLPASDLIPVSMFIEAMQSLQTKPEVFQYGETRGYEPLLDYIKQNFHLSENTASIVCNGSQQGLDLIARAFLNPSDIVVMEAPSYLGALQVFGLARAEVLAIEQNTNGPDLNALEKVFKAQQVKLFYCVPDFHNPTGVCWSMNIRQGVADLCQRYEVMLIEDAPYRELRFHGEQLPMVSSLCVDQSMVLRSFSKVSAPGVRLGVVSANSDLISSLIKVKQAADLHTGIPMQAALLQVLEHAEFEDHLKNVRNHYKDKAGELSRALEPLKHLGCTYDQVDGGMFIWLKLPENVNAISLSKVLIERSIAVVPSDVFYHEESMVEAALRLNFTHASSRQIEHAALMIQQALVEVE